MDVDYLKHRFEDGYVGVVTRTNIRIGIRHVQTLYMFILAVIFGIMRGYNGIAIMAINDETRFNDTYIQVYNWNKRIQGTVLSSYFWGYTLMIIPAEIYFRKISGKIVIAAALLTNGALFVALPTIVNKGGWVAMCNAQFILGMSQAYVYPVIDELSQKWLPPFERKIFSRIISSGLLLGVMIAFPFSTAITKTALGWELVFYSMAMMTLSYFVIWTLLTSPSPEDHPAAGDKEKEFIQDAINCYKKKVIDIRWDQILTSKRFWAVACAHAASSSVFVFFLVDIPVYLHHVQNVPLMQSAWYASFPFIALWLTYIATSSTLEIFYKIGFINYMLSLSQFRKTVNAFGASGVVMCLCALSYVGPEDTNLVIILLFLTLGLMGIQYCGFLETYSDMSENLSSTLMTLGSAFASIFGALTPILSGCLLNNDVSDLKQWRAVFLCLVILYILCNVVYTILGNSENQFWDNNCNSTKYSYYNDINQMELEDFRDKTLDY